MAALTPVQLELANSLTQDELPTKLRCAICSKLAVNAFRLPCCETAICENCQSTLPSSCPVCEHSPVSGTDCTVYKSLRTTIKVFLKTEEKRRESARPKPSTEPAPPTPVEAVSTPTQSQPQAQAPAAEPDRTDLPASPKAAVDTSGTSAEVEAQGETATTAEDGPHSHPEPDSKPDTHPDNQGSMGGSAQDKTETSQLNGEADENSEEVVENAGENSDEQAGQAGAGFGYPQGNGVSNGINYGDNMNQMQMMMAMQNGMNPASFGSSFPMMGMDMGMMNPMMMQNMYMNGGGYGMQGMNGMNMNMGMNGFDGSGNGWNEQQSWSVGQDNFNPNAPGMGNGDFNSGFRTGNYGYQNQYNDYGRGGHGIRGRGRGRGRGFYNGYGRGYHQGYNNPHNTNNNHWAGQPGQPSNYGVAQTPDGGQGVEAPSRKPNESVQEGHGTEDDFAATESAHVSLEDRIPQEGNEPPENDDMSQEGGGGHNSAQASIPEVPFNAPTGPKAMRQGLPNTSLHSLKARGLISSERSPSISTNGQITASPVEDRPKPSSNSVFRMDRDYDSQDQVREPRDNRRRDDRLTSGRTRSKSRSVSRSRSRSRTRKDSRKHRRQRSRSASDGGHDDEYRRRKHKSRRKTTRDDDDYKGRSRDDKYDDRSRSASPGDREHKRSSHRSRRDRDQKRRDRERGKDKGESYDRHRRSEHRSYRDRDGDRGRESNRARDRRERDDEYRDRKNSKSTTMPLTPLEPPEKGFNPPTGPKGDLSIKGASAKSSGRSGEKDDDGRTSRRNDEPSRRASQHSSSGISKDTHTLEREKRDRERLLKEAQRMAGLVGRGGSKRPRENGDDRQGRRKSRRSEAVSADDEEARMRRLEQEREGGRWS